MVQLQGEVSIGKMGVQFPGPEEEMACDQRERVFSSSPALMGYELGIDEEVGEGVGGGYHTGLSPLIIHGKQKYPIEHNVCSVVSDNTGKIFVGHVPMAVLHCPSLSIVIFSSML